MRLKQNGPFKVGYNSITEINGKHSDMLMDYGVLKLAKSTLYKDNADLERVILLMYGEIEVSFNGETYIAKRKSFLDDDFWV